MSTLWSGRFDSAPDPDAFDFGVSFGFDRKLFEDDASNTVKNFVWLAKHGFYDGSPVARTVPRRSTKFGGALGASTGTSPT